MYLTGMWKKRFRKQPVRCLLGVVSMLLFFTVGLSKVRAEPRFSPVCSAQQAYLKTMLSGTVSKKTAGPRILDCGRSPDGHGVYVLFSNHVRWPYSLNPGFHYAIEYDAVVRKFPSIRQELADELEVHVYDIWSGERLYTADVAGMLREVRENIRISPDLSIRITENGQEYLMLNELVDIRTGSTAQEMIALDLASGELVLDRQSQADNLELFHQGIRKTGWLSSLYTNLLEINGFRGVRTIARPSCFVLEYSPGKSLCADQRLTEYFTPHDLRLWNNAPYVLCVFDPEQSQASIVRALFGDYDQISWEQAVIYDTASLDGCEHPIRSEQDFYQWYRYDESGMPRLQKAP